MAEVVRRMEEISRQMAEILRVLSKEYVRKDVYEAERKADQQMQAATDATLTGLIKDRQTDRRLVWGSLALPLLVGVALLAVSAFVR